MPGGEGQPASGTWAYIGVPGGGGLEGLLALLSSKARGHRVKLSVFLPGFTPRSSPRWPLTSLP